MSSYYNVPTNVLAKDITFIQNEIINLYFCISMITNQSLLSAYFGNLFYFFLNRKVRHFANAYRI